MVIIDRPAGTPFREGCPCGEITESSAFNCNSSYLCSGRVASSCLQNGYRGSHRRIGDRKGRQAASKRRPFGLICVGKPHTGVSRSMACPSPATGSRSFHPRKPISLSNFPPSQSVLRGSALFHLAGPCSTGRRSLPCCPLKAQEVRLLFPLTFSGCTRA